MEPQQEDQEEHESATREVTFADLHVILRVLLVVCGVASFLWLLTIGIATISPSAMPGWLEMKSCSSETSVSVETKGGEETDQPTTRGPSSTSEDEISQKLYIDQKCQPRDIPSSQLIAASALTVFFFSGIVAPLLRGVSMDAGFFKFQGRMPAPSSLAAKAANATDAGLQEFESNTND